MLRRLFDAVDIEAEVLVVYDGADDTTIPTLTQLQLEFKNLRSVQNTYGRGPAKAIKFGIDRANAKVTVVTRNVAIATIVMQNI